MDRARRGLLGLGAGLAALGAARPALALAALTPRQGPGPFYPTEIPLDHDADLVTVAGHGARAQGTVAELVGHLKTPEGRAVAGARMEIWQCDAFGRYHHPRHGGGADPGFQGFGRTETDAQGRYRFRTIKPVPYPGRTPHIHMRITSGTVDMTTQIYVAGEPRNETDFLLRRIADPVQRAAVIVPFAPDPGLGGVLLARFDPVILG